MNCHQQYLAIGDLYPLWGGLPEHSLPIYSSQWRFQLLLSWVGSSGHLAVLSLSHYELCSSPHYLQLQWHRQAIAMHSTCTCIHKYIQIESIYMHIHICIYVYRGLLLNHQNYLNRKRLSGQQYYTKNKTHLFFKL